MCLSNTLMYNETHCGLPDFVEMWAMDDQRDYWETKFRIEGKWTDLEYCHRLLKIMGNGKVLIFAKKHDHKCTKKFADI